MQAPRPNVLIVDDEEIVCAGLKRLLKEFDKSVSVETVMNPLDAETALEAVRPNIVLIDFELDGVNLSRRLKQLQPELKTMILIPAHLTPGFFSLTLSAADGYGLKTIAVEDLFAAIECILANAAWIDPAITGQLISLHLRKHTKKGAYDLTQRELDILALVVDGCSNVQIAELLDIHMETVKTHLRNILKKMSVRDRTQAAVKALRQGVIS